MCLFRAEGHLKGHVKRHMNGQSTGKALSKVGHGSLHWMCVCVCVCARAVTVPGTRVQRRWTPPEALPRTLSPPPPAPPDKARHVSDKASHVSDKAGHVADRPSDRGPKP
eukprot:206134-Rhodomonas_salina.1